MKFYFQLQILRIERYFREAGVRPILGFILSGFLFVVLSLLLFDKLETAVYVYIALALLLIAPLNNSGRIDFLAGVFNRMSLRLVRFIENVLCVIPFCLMLMWQEEYALSGVLLTLSALMSWLAFRGGLGIVIPTPFSKQPFEFTRGFRQILWLLVMVYIRTTISVVVGNYNLGVFSMALIYLISLSFYNKPEPLFFVWVHSCNTEVFLKRKIMSASKYVTILAVPIAIALIIMNPQSAWVILAGLVIGPLYTILSLLAKYAFYPAEINIIPAISIALSIVFPPLVLIAIPFFYRQCLKNLRPILL